MVEIIVSSIVTIIGFGASFLGIRRELKNSLQIQQSEFVLQKLDNIIELIDECIIYDDVTNDNKSWDDQVQLLRNNLNRVYKRLLPYGSREDLMIIATLYEAAYTWEETEERKHKYVSYNLYFTAVMYLLMCQIKKEMTGSIINPEILFRRRYINYNKGREILKRIINDTVNDLGLCKEFLIK